MSATLIARKLGAGLALAAAFHLASADDDVATAPLAQNPALAAALRSAEVNGLEIYWHDHATAVASDAMMKIGMAKDNRVRGWVTQRRQTDIVVTFVGVGQDKLLHALYRATVTPDGKVAPGSGLLAPVQALTQFELEMLAARATAAASSFTPCTPKYNTVVLPVMTNNVRHWAVFLLPATTDRTVIPLGGAYRIMTSADGQQVESSRTYTRSCITLANPANGVANVVSHLMDAIPTEVHVFWQRWSGKPMWVTIPSNGSSWSIAEGKIMPEKGEPAKP